MEVGFFAWATEKLASCREGDSITRYEYWIQPKIAEPLLAVGVGILRW